MPLQSNVLDLVSFTSFSEMLKPTETGPVQWFPGHVGRRCDRGMGSNQSAHPFFERDCSSRIHGVSRIQYLIYLPRCFERALVLFSCLSLSFMYSSWGGNV
jgi:hypothetical protein